MKTKYTHIVSFYGIHCLWAEDTQVILPLGLVGKIFFALAVRFHI